ncbi:MAG: alpha/beta fold hydrolase [Desulfatitalea sp.]|nr:alpha/beta fold hydrolase [Desulfatitalea sp.]
MQGYPFKNNYLTIRGMRYHYLDEGQGEPLVMLHGNPTWSFYFRRLVENFRSTHRVIVPDHMGCGLSEKPGAEQYDFRLQSRIDDLNTLLDHLNLDQPVTLIVHDWGGMIGLGWAVDHLERVQRLVIMNTAGFFPPRGKAIPWRLRLLRRPNPLMDWAVLHLNLFARAALYMAPRRPLPPAVKAGLIAPYDTPHNRLATLKFVQDIPLSPDDPSGPIVARVERELERIAARPMLIIWGRHDFVFDRDYFDEWRRRVPQAEIHWLDEAGHYLLEDAPEKIAGLIAAFLKNSPNP